MLRHWQTIILMSHKTGQIDMFYSQRELPENISKLFKRLLKRSQPTETSPKMLRSWPGNKE